MNQKDLEQKLKKGIRYAQTSVAAEGPKPSKEAIDISIKYLRGEISEEEALKRLKRL